MCASDTHPRHGSSANYSNPAAIVAEATRLGNTSNYKILNICDMPVSIMLSFAKDAQVWKKYNVWTRSYFGFEPLWLVDPPVRQERYYGPYAGTEGKRS